MSCEERLVRTFDNIYTNKIHCRFVCLSVCLAVIASLFSLKSERHETRHFLRLKGSFFRFFVVAIFQYNLLLVIIEISMACDISFYAIVSQQL